MKIHVIVSVTYDYYRFQDNILASMKGIREVRKLAEEISKKMERPWSSEEGPPVYIYKPRSDSQKELDRGEWPHIWIQTLTAK